MRIRTSTLFCFLACCGLFFSSPASAQDAPFWLEDFANGIPDTWMNQDESGNNALWTWCADPTTGQANGCPALWDDTLNEQEPFSSSTADNGFVTLDSDLAGNITHTSRLTTDAIDCSAFETVFLAFETHIGVFTFAADENALVRVSTNGADWTDFTVFPGLTTAERWSENPEIVSIDISSVAAGQSTVFVEFYWFGSFEYMWSIDDIGLYEFDPFPAPNNDLVGGSPFFGPTYVTPFAQVDSIPFIYNITNQGLLDQTNLIVQATVEGENGEFFQTTEEVDVLAAETGDTTIVLPEQYLPEAEGLYTITYSVSQDSMDANPDDNLSETNFFVSSDFYAMDDLNPVFSTQPLDISDDTWEIGNVYSVPNGGFEAYEVEFSVASADEVHIGRSAIVFLYQYIGDGPITDATLIDENLIPVGVGNYTFGENDTNFELVTVELEDLLGEGAGVELVEGSQYIVTLVYDTDMRVVFSDNVYPYTVATVVRNGGWFAGGFGDDVSAVARLRIRDLGSFTTNVDRLELDLNVYPNPARDQLTAQLELPATADKLEVRIIDVYGRSLLVQEFDNFRQETFEFDTSRLPAGTYYLNLRTEEGIHNEMFTIQR